MGFAFRMQGSRATRGDTTPDAFTFSDVGSQAISSTMTSNTITISGCPDSAVVSVSGGTYSKNSGGYTSGGGTAVTGDTFAVRHTSAATFDTLTNTTLTVGGVSDTYSSSTVATAPTYTNITMVVTAIGNVNPDGSFGFIDATSYHPVNANTYLVGGDAHYLVNAGTTNIFQLAAGMPYAMYLTGTMALNYTSGRLDAQTDIDTSFGAPSLPNLVSGYRLYDPVGVRDYPRHNWQSNTIGAITGSTQECRVLGAGAGANDHGTQAQLLYAIQNGHPAPGSPGTIGSPGAGPFGTIHFQFAMSGNGDVAGTTVANPLSILAVSAYLA